MGRNSLKGMVMLTPFQQMKNGIVRCQSLVRMKLAIRAYHKKLKQRQHDLEVKRKTEEQQNVSVEGFVEEKSGSSDVDLDEKDEEGEDEDVHASDDVDDNGEDDVSKEDVILEDSHVVEVASKSSKSVHFSDFRRKS